MICGSKDLHMYTYICHIKINFVILSKCIIIYTYLNNKYESESLPAMPNSLRPHGLYSLWNPPH